MYIYIFGSICRGEIDKYSDVDLLAIIDEEEKSNYELDTDKFSVYQISSLTELWNEGNPFAWHLHLESKLIHSTKNDDVIQKWGKPKPYMNMELDLSKFSKLFFESVKSLENSSNSEIFDLSMIFLAIRNFATCFSLGYLNEYNFSRYSALNLSLDSLAISQKNFEILERARILSTRGNGIKITQKEVQNVIKEMEIVKYWFEKISQKI